MTIDAATHEITLAIPAWIAVCRLDDLAPERGSAALVGGEQVALFRTHSDDVYAVQQLDPFSGAFVMSRGIVGTRGDAPTVASPMYKQVFDLRTGECLDAVGKEPQSLRSWPAEVRDGVVHVARPQSDEELST
ncbi:Nitrite reductase (NAD(P)H), small subunit [Janibacter sp. HTCC2649]|uniref:nitrite reductase small subunit NirD n=1 Tax=Janibacter sp. HTCC2649 TaxID=313589 RepID=UPI00006708FB|nr:nitrite reductase small subunit NirD [Janibacter sp. HTCC2649]EAP99767.1 Nitrite reductase (NAD(P)H), small subunit [Janibacter sp. HTCC2649]